MRTKFSTLLLTGKAATLPLLIGNAHAVQTWTPSMYAITTEALTQVQIPVTKEVELNSFGQSSPAYDGSATLCSVNGAVTAKMGVVLTGLKDQDVVYVLTSTDMGGNQSLHPNIKIGNRNLFIPKSMRVGANGSESISATLAIELRELAQQGYSMANGSKFYMQTVVFPAAALASDRINWSLAKISELDVVSINSCTSYGPHGQLIY